jgi:hypothetical protein
VGPTVPANASLPKTVTSGAHGGAQCGADIFCIFWLRWLCDGASELGAKRWCVWCSFHCQEQIRRLSGLHGDAQALP